MMSPQQFPALAAALCALVGLAAALLAGFGSAGIDTAMPIENRRAASPGTGAELAPAPETAITDTVVASADAELAHVPETAITSTVVANADADTALALVTPALVTEAAREATAAPDQPAPFVVAALPEPSQMTPDESQPAQTATANTPDPAPGEDQVVSVIEVLDECFVLEVCVDHYLWALYERTAKQDTNKVHETRKVKVWRKGKTVTVRKRFVRLVDQDFTWKDPIAAKRVGMPMMDYVIGGMDPAFKLKLFHTLRAAEKDGLAPGITSGFRDDYRQSIASGQKAAANRSYHGGSLRGGYGHGVAADVVSVKGATRAQRWVSSDALWKWIDTNEQQFGVGRPYLNKDPPHVAPVDGEEYASRRGTKTQNAQADVNKPARQAVAKKPARQAVAKTKKGGIVRAASAARPAKQAAAAGRAKVAAASLKRD